jgi:TonB-linked SusC/RagA family outer membrane protein
MSFAVRRIWSPALLALALVSTAAVRGEAQQQTTVAGRVTAKENDQPLAEARVIVVGTSLFTITNADGRYSLRGVPAGTAEVRVLRVGYAEQKKPVTVAAGQATTLDFVLSQTVVQLQAVVTTATGEQRRVELGNAVSSIDVAKKIEEAPIRNMGDVLVAKAPGVQVLPANMTGGGSRVRVRGTASISLSNDPIYVIDGVRMTSTGSGSIGVGGTSFSRVNDINPDEIENIEVVKGPSAATLYGTDAANGVIVITTKKGRAGAPRWTVFGDYGAIQDKNDYPSQYAILGHLPATPTVARKCLLKELSLGTCIKDSTSVLNVFKDPDITPIHDGWRRQLGAQLSGGTEAIRYFLSGDNEKEIGPFGMPAFDIRRFNAAKIQIKDEWDRPNTLTKNAYRANLNVAVNSNLDVAVQSGWTRLDQRLPQVDNNVNSFWYNGMIGPGYKKAGPGYTGIGSLGQELNGYANYTPGDIFQRLVTQGVQRFIGSTSANWRPVSWLQNRADFGVDLTDRFDFGLCRLAECADFGTNRLGTVTNSRADVRNITGNLGSTASWQPMSWLNLKTTGGIQYVNYLSDQNTAGGATLPPGTQTPGAAVIPNSSSATTLQKTLGIFVEEAAALNDRLFLTAAIRTDQNSAFGTNFQRVYYPKGSISWLASEESFFPTLSWLNSLRFRAALGAAGVQPGPNDADRTFQVATTSIAAVDLGGLQSNALGNSDLKPERSTELEAGFESQMFSNRINFEFTYYRKTSKDALINLVLAPSSGASATNVRTNLGSVRNWGYEGLINGQVLDNKYISWDILLNASHNSNEVISLGVDKAGKPIPTIGAANTRQAEGFPTNSYWTRRYKFSDANKDGILVPAEVQVDSGYQYLGYSQPRLELSVTNGIDILNKKLRITALVDHKSGYYVSNTEQSFLCQQTTSCIETSSLGVPLWRQARAIALRDGTNIGGTTFNSPHGYYEKPNFWRIRELSANYNLPDYWVERLLKVRGASLNLAARNVAVFTDWTGVDPEQNYGENDTQQTLLTAGPPRYYTVRMFLRF